jgi:hypothetical protein
MAFNLLKPKHAAILLQAYERRKCRILMACQFRLWKHHVMYGKAGNAHTKVELLKGLHTLKHRVTALEQYVAQQREANENVENLLDAEKESRWDCFFVRTSGLFQGLGPG